MSKSITVTLEQKAESFTIDNVTRNYFSYTIPINGIPIRVKPVDSTAKRVLEIEFAKKGG